MNILFVTQFFYPENFRINDIARRLVERGHKVTVLTGMPNYPGGEFFEGYSNKGLAGVGRVEKWENIKIVRVPIIPRKTGSLRLCLNYLSFIISGCREVKRGKLLAECGDFDVIYAFGTSPITQALPAIAYKKKKGARIALNVQDLWPDNVVAITGIRNRLVVGLLDKLVDYIYNRCDVILGTSNSFVKAITARRGLKDKSKVLFYPQYSVVKMDDASEGISEFGRSILPEGRFHIVFTGNVGYGQGLDLVVLAAKRLKAEKSDIVFDIVGDGRAREELDREIKKNNLSDYVVLHGSFPEERIPQILSAADASLLILKRDPIFEKTIPAKLQTYLACGCPVLGCVSGEAADIIRDNNIGICADEFSEKALYDAVIAMRGLDEAELDGMRQACLSVSRKYFDADMLISKLESLLRDLC